MFVDAMSSWPVGAAVGLNVLLGAGKCVLHGCSSARMKFIAMSASMSSCEGWKGWDGGLRVVFWWSWLERLLKSCVGNAKMSGELMMGVDCERGAWWIWRHVKLMLSLKLTLTVVVDCVVFGRASVELSCPREYRCGRKAFGATCVSCSGKRRSVALLLGGDTLYLERRDLRFSFSLWRASDSSCAPATFCRHVITSCSRYFTRFFFLFRCSL
jgi:hypothetical protein